MKLVVVVCLIACGASPPPPKCPTVGPPPAPVTAKALDDAAAIAKTHAFFDLMDRGDIAGFRTQLDPAFVLFEEARFLTADDLAKGMQARLDKHGPPRTRTWSDERVYRSAGAVVTIGDSVEHYPADGDQPAADFEGYNTIVWVPDGERWVIAHWGWSRAGLEAERQRWNDWLTKGVGFSHKPNQLLVDTVKGRKPGAALDLASGQGRNAVFLATQGWKTTAVDIADEGLRITREDAARAKTKVETINADIDKWDLGIARWDLVTMIYAGNDLKLVERIKPSLKKGGLFVTEYFANDSEIAKSGAGGWDDPALAAAFKSGDFKILRDDHVEDNADWAGQRKTKLVRFVAQKL